MRQVPEGMKVHITHLRYAKASSTFTAYDTAFNLKKRGLTPESKGGTTIASIINERGNVVAVGRAFCSLQDQFNYRRGRLIATGRALKELEARRR